MSFDSGSITFQMFYLPSPMPEDYIERFRAKAAPPISTLGAEPIHGWVTGRHQLDRDITHDTAHIAGYLRMTLMRAERKIPESLLRAECRMEEIARMKAEGRTEIDRRTRSEIRKEVFDRLLPTAQPQIKGMSLVWKPGTKILFCEATSDNQRDALQAAWRETFGFNLVPATPEYSAIYGKYDILNIAPTSFSPDCDDSACALVIGEEFLTWLWFESEHRGGNVHLSSGDFGILIQGPLMLSSDGQGAHEVGLRHGAPEISAEAKIALLSGKKLYCATLVLARGKDYWQTRLLANRFVFRGVRLPESESLDQASRFQERMANVEVFTDAFMDLYKQFLDERTDEHVWQNTQSLIHQWVTDRAGRK